jgi:hypothetical protein
LKFVKELVALTEKCFDIYEILFLYHKKTAPSSQDMKLAASCLHTIVN